MAEATYLRNNCLPYPIYSAPWTIVAPLLDADGDLISGAAGLDSEISKNGDTFTDCTNEATQIATDSGMYYLSLTGTELTADIVVGIIKTSTSGAKTTPFVLYPRKLVTIRSGTSAGGDTAYITLDASASAVDDYYNGMVCVATIDTNVECRVITDYTGSNKQAAVTPAWNVAPDNDDTFIVYLPEGAQMPAMTGATLTAIPAVASVTNGVTLADDAITAAKFDESTAFPLKSADTGSTAVARVGADSDTLETLSDQIDAVQASLGTVAPTSDTADSFSAVAGTIIAGDYTKTQTDDNDRHTLAPENPGGIDATYVFQCGVGRAPTAVNINGYFSGAGQYCDVYAYDYGLGIWDKLSNTSTYMGTRNNETNYSYALNREHMDLVTNVGDVSIRFVSPSTNTAHRLYLDRILVNTVSDSSGAGASGATPQQIWEYTQRTLTTETGEPADVEAIADAVWDELGTGHTDAGKAGAQLWTDIDAILDDTGTAGVVLSDDAITAAKFDESTAFPLKAADTGATYIARAPSGTQTLDSIASAISAIGSGTGAALNFAVVEDNASAPIKSVTAVGTQIGTYANTLADDGTTHQIASVGNAIDWVYGFSCGTARSASKFVCRGNMSAIGDTVTVQAYNFDTLSWVTRTTISGAAKTLRDVPLLSGHTGTGTDEGKVYIRFLFAEGDAGTLVIDEAYVQAQQSGSLVGYVDGIEVDTLTGTAGTAPYVNGTKDNPVLTWADALTLSALTAIKQFKIHGGSSITLTADSSNVEIIGSAYDLDLNGQIITNAHIIGARVVGIGINTSTAPVFEYCGMGAVTLGPSRLYQCGIGRASGAFTAGSAGQFVLVDCFSLVPGSGTPTLAFNSLGGTTGINNRGWKGGATYTLDSTCTLSHEVVAGGGTTITTGGANCEVRGICRAVTLVLSASETVQFAGVTGPVTISGAAVAATVNLYGVHGVVTNTSTGSTVNTLGISRATINAEADTALADYDPPTNTELEARTLLAASYFDPAADVVAHVTLVDTTTTNTDMRGTDGAYTGTPPSTADIKTSLEADGGKLDHLWETTEDDGGVRRFTLNALELAPGGSGGTTDTVYTATVDGLPTAGVYCRLCTDTAGLVNIDAGLTNSLGQVTFSHSLPSGTTVYIFPSKDGVEFDFDGAGRRYDIEVIP